MIDTPNSLSTIKVFVGYQIDSEYHDHKSIRSLIDKLYTELREENDINIEVTYGVFEPGSNIWKEVQENITESQVAIFDISENNPDVLVEVGLAHGMDAHVIMLKNKDAEDEHERPSDLLPLTYQSYSPDELDSSEVVENIKKSIVSFMEERHGEEFYFRQVWGFEQTEPVVVACSELPYADQFQKPESSEFFYLGKLGDVDSLVEVLTNLNSLYPRANIDFKSANEVSPESLQKNIVLVGGPDYNQLADRFSDRIPLEYCTEEDPHNIYLRHEKTGETYHPSINKESTVDYGFFAKTKNPYNPKNNLIFLGGCHTYGVYGAAKAFAYHSEDPDPVSHENCRKIIDKYGTDPNFCAPLKVDEVSKQGVLTPQVNLNNCEHLAVKK